MLEVINKLASFMQLGTPAVCTMKMNLSTLQF